MDENKNTNSIAIDQKPNQELLKEPKISNGEGASNDAELQKPIQKETTCSNFESRPQTRQLKEAGSSTFSTDVVIKDVKTMAPKDCSQAQVNNFKPANETKDGGEIPVIPIKEGKEGSSDGCDTQNLSKNTTLDKTPSYDDGCPQVRESFLKNSTKAQSQNLPNGKSVEISVEEPKSEGNSPLKDASHEKKLTSPSREEEKAKRSCIEPNYTVEESKSSVIEKNFEDSNKDVSQIPLRRISKEKAEEICLGWINGLNSMEAKTDIPCEKDCSGKEMPEYCSNRICPISIEKIQKTTKVMKKLKKVKMRKVNLKNEYTNEERWYCLKCIKAHNESLYCFYCCQIYFSEEEGLEDEEKIWICCDKCDRWIHLECDIKTGNNTKLKEQDYKAKSFKYSCPECRPSSVKKNTTKKEQRKATKKSLPTKSERTKKIRAGESQGKDQISEINSQQNRLQNSKSSGFENEMKMEESQDHNMGVEDSYTYQDEESKNDKLEINHKGYSVASNDSRRVNKSRKAKKSKNSREKMARNRGKLKRSHEEYSQMDYQSGMEAIKELTRYRSLKIAKEREDIVDPRSLAPKVLQFCGITPNMIMERVDRDLELIKQQLQEDIQNGHNITTAVLNELSESEVIFNSPEKELERASYRANSSMRLANSSFGGVTTENGYGKALRPRRSRVSRNRHQ